MYLIILNMKYCISEALITQPEVITPLFEYFIGCFLELVKMNYLFKASE